MEQVNINIIKYKAFDGTMFDNQTACMKYEIEKRKENVTNFRQFDLVFPMQDQATSCTAYLIQSEKEFEMFLALLDDEYPEFDAYWHVYEGSGWYVLQSDECGWADVIKLSKIIQDWNKAMDKIVQHTMNNKEEEV